ncbi:MAG: polysaccharide biosynthesis tyrosine autokinase [Caulobacterales bacterium]|nr:polysaccharide biosynthesis tyrosine autokinase [Caulobacterales bacterium]
MADDRIFGEDDEPRRLPGAGRGLTPRGPDGVVDVWRPERVVEEPAIDLAQYWRLLFKYRFVIAACFIGAIVLGVAATLLMTPIYTATTTIQIDRESARVLETSDVSPNAAAMQAEEFFQTQYGLIRSRSLAQRVAESEGLAADAQFLEAMGMTSGDGAATGPASLARRQDAVVGMLQANLGVQPARGSRLVNITFDSPDPAQSARIANAFAVNFIQANLDRKFDSSSYARDFLEQRLAQTKTRLEEAERSLVAYAQQQGIINVDETTAAGGDPSGAGSRSLAANDLLALNSSLARVRADRIAAEQKWNQVNSSSLMSLPEVLQNPAIQRLTENRATLNAEYQQKLSIYRPEFPEMLQLKARIDETDSQIRTLAGEIRSSIRQNYQAVLGQERALQGQVNGLKGDVLDLRSRSIQYNILQREVDTTRSLYDGLLQRYKEVGVAGGITANNISIVDRARPPGGPSKPNMMLNLAIAAILGLGFGVLLAFAMEALDQSLSTPEDVESKLDVAVLGAVPILPRGQTPVEALADLRSGFAEAYYSLRTALQFSTPNGAPSTLFITSARPGEGKSTTALAIAENFARIGHRVLLVDVDLRKPSMHRLLGANNDRGMSSILSGSATLSDVVQRPEDGGLWFIPCGPLPPNPAELLSGARVQGFLDESRRRFDIVVIDGPPTLGFADAPAMAANVAGTVFVIEANGTRRGQARGALARLRMGRARILGAVLTKFNAKSSAYGAYDYAYDYAYGADSNADRKADV